MPTLSVNPFICPQGTVTLSQQHINRGIRNTPRLCPVALALNQAFGISETEVFASGWVKIRGVWWLALSRAACDFVDRFDDGKPVLPLKFRLRPCGPPRLGRWSGVSLNAPPQPSRVPRRRRPPTTS